MRLLLIWPYERGDLLRNLLTAADGCEVVLLHHKHRFEGDADPGVPVRYWSDWKTPAALLNELRPDKLVFWDIETFLQASLNIEARHRGIPTYILEHGLRTRQDVIGVPEDVKAGARNRFIPDLSTLRFFWSAIRLRHLRQLPAILRFMYVRWSRGPFALRDCRLELRNADWYVTFGLAGTEYWRLREGLPLSRFLLIGNPAFDEFLGAISPVSPVLGRYYLLLDVPMVEAAGMPAENKRRFLLKLGEFVRSKGAKLVVKLHPASYRDGQLPGYLPADPDFVYYTSTRTGELAALVRHASGCFAMLTTLAVVAVALVPCILFTMPGRDALQDLIDRKLVLSLDFESFDWRDLSFDAVTPDAAALAALVRDYLHSTDGGATARLRQVLLEPSSCPPYRVKNEAEMLHDHSVKVSGLSDETLDRR